MKYAHYNPATNEILGWYSDDIHGTKKPNSKDKDNKVIDNGYDISSIPTPHIEVSEADWQEAINTNANVIDRGKFTRKDFRTTAQIEAEDELVAWAAYKSAEEENRKKIWKDAGKPKFK